MKPIAIGKVKDIYEAGQGQLQFHFSDRVSAFDVKFEQTIPRKGEVLCAFARYWFEVLGVSHHYVKQESRTDIIVKKMDMIPLECVARGYLYGSLYDRYSAGKTPHIGAGLGLADRLPEPIFDPTTKSKHDIPVNKETAVKMGLVDVATYNQLESKTLEIYAKMSRIAMSAGFVMADLKLEFGTLDGNIVLGDSIGPDEYRLWPVDTYSPGKTQSAFDKQILRDWLAKEGYKEKFEQQRAEGKEPTPPSIPAHIIEKMTNRYIEAYTRITSKAFN